MCGKDTTYNLFFFKFDMCGDKRIQTSLNQLSVIFRLADTKIYKFSYLIGKTQWARSMNRLPFIPTMCASQPTFYLFIYLGIKKRFSQRREKKKKFWKEGLAPQGGEACVKGPPFAFVWCFVPTQVVVFGVVCFLSIFPQFGVLFKKKPTLGITLCCKEGTKTHVIWCLLGLNEPQNFPFFVGLSPFSFSYKQQSNIMPFPHLHVTSLVGVP